MHAALRIGTRGSRLASAQARLFQSALGQSGDGSQLVEVRTRGDAISARNGRAGFEATDGQFTAELEESLLRGDVDVAVHSYKDLPTGSSPGVVVAAVLPRADARDCLLTRGGGGLGALSHGAKVGTGSVRRARQLLVPRPDLRIEPIRGNVETRIARMERGEYDAIVLACAGLDRLGIAVPNPARLPFAVMLPAPAQGALAVQVRAEDTDLLARLRMRDHAPTRIAVEAERALLREVGGGCLAPLGAFAAVADGRLRLRAIFLPDDGAEPARVDVSAPVERVDELVADAAKGLVGGESGR